MATPTKPKLTPLMAQYRRIKSGLPSDALLLFRLGDFYEMFLEDAQEGAGILEVALTKRGGMPMCGIPYHAADTLRCQAFKGPPPSCSKAHDEGRYAGTSRIIRKRAG